MAQDTKAANDLKPGDPRLNKAEMLRSAVGVTEQMGQAATEAGARIGQAAASSGARIGQAAAEAGADLGRDLAGQASSINNEFMRRLADMKLPTLPDMTALVEAQQRNMEAFLAANRVAMEAAQAMGRRQAEIAQRAMQDLTEGWRRMMGGDAPQVKAAAQAEQMKRSGDRLMADIREMRELAQRSSGEALELLHRRFGSAMDEAKALIEKSQTAARPV